MTALAKLNQAKLTQRDLSTVLAEYAAEVDSTVEGDRLKFNKGTWTANDIVADRNDTYRFKSSV